MVESALSDLGRFRVRMRTRPDGVVEMSRAGSSGFGVATAGVAAGAGVESVAGDMVRF